MLKSKVLFFVTGSIAAFKAAQVVSRLVQDDCEVQCVMSPSALRFVGEATFEGLTGRRVLTDLWESGRAMDHIHLSRWADFGVVCPASANTLSQMALGLADGIVSSTLLAWPRGKRLFVFPAMNSEMWAAAPVQQHVHALRSRGLFVAESESGNLACGEVGAGRLLEPDQILQIVRPVHAHKKRRILITAGATREPIDGIRFITNHSTGRTGAALCEEFLNAGWSVTHFRGQGAVSAGQAVDKSVEFSSFADLRDKLRFELGAEAYDAVVHCAAVSDYTVKELSRGDRLASVSPDELLKQKMPSGKDLILNLAPTEKILPLLREFSRNKNVRIVGFKLTLNSTPDEMLAAARKILTESVDAVVANDWSQVVVDRNKHPGVVSTKNGQYPFSTVNELSGMLSDWILNSEERTL